jgi:peptide/nickel transport system substrate-binding protein
MSGYLSRRAFLTSFACAGAVALAACSNALPAVPTRAPDAAKPAGEPTRPPVATSPADAAKPSATAQPAAVPGVVAKPTSNVPRNKTLIMGFEGGPVTPPDQMNPNVPNARNSFGLHQTMIESLWYLNYEDGQMIPWLGESYEFNKDFTQVTIKLRKGVMWSDGQPFSARDVVFTTNMLKEAGPNLSYGPLMKKYVAGVRAVNDNVVEFNLTTPYPRFLLDNFAVHIWGAVRILPEHIWKGQDPNTFNNYDPTRDWPIFTGPYRLVKASETEFIFDRRDDWWGKTTGFKELPAPERIIFVDQGSQDRRVALLQNNEVDALPQINAGPFQTALARNNNVIGWTDGKAWSWIDPCPTRMVFNNAAPPWNDPDIHWALNYGLDKLKYIEVGSEGLLGKEALSRFVFPDYPTLRALLDKNQDLFDKVGINEYNPQKARDRLASKGYKPDADGILIGPNGKRFEATMVTQSAAEGQNMAPLNLIAEQYKSIGLDVNVKQLSGAARNEAVFTGDFDLLPYHNCGGVVDPFGTLDIYNSRYFAPKGERLQGGNQFNTPRWKSPKSEEFSKLADQVGLLAPGDPNIEPLFRQALDIWLQELPNFPLQQQFRIVPYNTTYWTNFPTAKNNYIHPPNWWMTTLLIIMNVKPR